MKYKYLTLNDEYKNANKYYEMKQSSPDYFDVSYGKVGSSGRTHSYSLSKWDTILNQKLRKGYQEKEEETGTIQKRPFLSIPDLFAKINNKGIREAALRNYKANPGTQKYFKYIFQALIQGFVWSDTPEGDDKWEEICNAYKKLELHEIL